MKIFWAWQSDLPGNVSRHFVRDALLAAIEKLRQAPDIEEPSEEARRSEMHLDSDRQGLPGSPDSCENRGVLCVYWRREVRLRWLKTEAHERVSLS